MKFNRYRIGGALFEDGDGAGGRSPHPGLLFICEVPGRRGLQWRVADTCIGTYGPISQCFHTDRVPARPDPRVIPWCDCCWQRDGASV
jgi:hypothetical protein